MTDLVSEHTPKLLRNGKPPHPLTPEQRAAGRAKALENRREKAEQYRMERLVPKSYKVFDLAMSNALKTKEVDSRALDAAKFSWEQEHGKATQRIETTEQASSPFDALSEADKELAIQAARQRLRALEGGKTGTDG